ncbi:hypothetical protein [Microcoleus phage My-WqHQDG]|nr:hypothetical protein [Microcoleus phage My-WqHQDG]
MTINTESVIEDNVEHRTMPATEALPEDSTAADYRPIPGMDILKVVYDEAVRRAENGVAPAYAFLRIDIYLLAQAANSAQGVMNWLDANTGLNCYILPLMPGEGQSPFILCDNLEQASQVLIASFPTGTFQQSPVDDDVATAPVDDTAPIVQDVVETTNG